MIHISKEREENHITILVNAKTRESEKIIKEEIQKALRQSKHLLEKKVSYEMYLKFNERV